MDIDGTREGSTPGFPVREQLDGTGRTIPTADAPDATTGKTVQEEDTRWWFLGIMGVGVLILLLALGIAFL